MASIKQLQMRKYKITVSNGYRPDGRKISRARTITVPDTVRKHQIPQYVAHQAEEFERLVKNGFCEDSSMRFEEYARRWLGRQSRYAPSTLASYRRMLEVVFPTSVLSPSVACGLSTWRTYWQNCGSGPVTENPSRRQPSRSI